MLSYGNLAGSLPLASASGLSFGEPVYDDAILRAARTRVPSTGTPTATRAANRPPLSFGSLVPSGGTTGPFERNTRLSLPSSVPQGNTSNLFNVSDFLRTASFGIPVNDTRADRAVYDDAILRSARNPVQPIPQVHTATIDGGAGISGALKRAAQDVLAGIGSRGDGDVVPVAFGGTQGGDNTLLYVAGAAALGLVAYYALS